MDCPNCGGQMGLEDAICPYCGTPNAQAAKHQSDMARYRREYRRTQADVMEKTSFLQRHGSWLVILTVLLVALTASVILNVYAWDIGYSMRESAAQRSFDEDTQVLDSYLEQGDYGQFLGYYSANDINLVDKGEYRALYTAAHAYVDLIESLVRLNDNPAYPHSPDYVSNTCGYIAEDLDRIYSLEQEYSYDADRYLPADRRVYIEDIRDRTAVIAKTYLGLSDEEVQDIPNVSKKKLTAIIEEGIA